MAIEDSSFLLANNPELDDNVLTRAEIMIKPRTIAVVSAGFLTLFIAFAVRYSYGLVLPYMLPSLAISKTEAGVIFSAYFVTASVLSPVMGILADRFSARIILAAFVAILGIGACLMSTASSVVQASIFFALIGVGHSACWAPIVSVVMRWVSPERRGIAVSIVDLGTTAGIAVWSSIVPVIISYYDWRTVWISLGVTALVVACMNFLLIRNYPDTQAGIQSRNAAQNPHTSIKESYRAILHDSKFHLIGISYLLISFSILIPFTFLVSHVTQKLMMPYAVATSLLIIVAVAGAIGKLILAHISDKAGRINIIILCGFLAAAGALGMAYARHLPALYLLSAIFGIGYGTIWALYAATARDLFPGEYSGSIIGLWTLFHGLGSVIAPIFSGWIIDRTGTYQPAFILSSITAILAVLLLLPVKSLSTRSTTK